MSASRPPGSLPAGDSIAFSLDFSSDYAGWTGSAVLGATEGTVSISGTTASVSFDSSDTEDLTPGRYTLAVALSNGSQRRTIASYSIQVTPNLIDATEGEATDSHASKMLAAIEAVLEGRVPKDVESYSIDGTTINKIPIERLIALRKQYAAEVARESNNGRIGSVQFAVPMCSTLPFHWAVRRV